MKKKIQKSNRGFTLVELVIVIAIVIILSVISVPIYRGYVDKSKYAEGYALLGTVISAQKTYYSEYGNFLKIENSSSGGNWTVNEPVLGVDARGNKYFKVFATNADSNKCWAYAQVPTEIAGNRTLGNIKDIYLYFNITSGVSYKEISY